jgi:putative ABC transport system permease protein
VRGAGTAQILRLAGVEALLVGAGGAVAGLAVGAAVVRARSRPRLGVAAPTAGAGRVGDGGGAGRLRRRRACVVVPPGWTCAGPRSARPGAPSTRPRCAPPLWARIGLDVALLVTGALLVRAASGTGYALVLAPRACRPSRCPTGRSPGALLWVGSGLLAWRLTDSSCAAATAPVGGASGRGRVVLDRRRDDEAQAPPLARSVALLGLALAFAASTATFNATTGPRPRSTRS